MAFKQFCSPHVHVSSLDSASTPAAFVRRELELGSKTLTTTDHGSLVACRQVYKLAKKAGLIPVVGVEGYFQDYSCERAQRSKYYHVTIHCPTQHCFEVVTKRISRADVERGQQAGSERKPIFTWEDLEEIAAAGATFGSGCLVGMVQRHLADSDDPEMAQKYFERLMNMAPGRFFVEVFPHRTDRNWMSGVRVTKEDGGKVDYRSKKKLRLDGGEIHVDDLPKLFSKNPQQYGRIRAVMENRKWVELAEPIVVRDAAAVDDYVKNDCSPWAPDGDSQEGANRFVLEMAAKYRIPVMISDDCHFTHPEDKVVQDVRLGAGSNGAWRMYSSYHRMSSDEAFAHFQASLGTTVKECEGWIDNSLAWAEMFRGFTLKSQPQLPTNFYPGDPIERLFDLIAAEGRFNPNDPRQVERLTKELGILHSNGRIDLIPYFFVTQEVVKLYESYGKLTGPGRGSAAGLLTAYLLGITHVDPIRFKLSTERFITKERILSGKMPDIDQDLPDRDLLEGVGDEPGWLHQRFGRHVAQIGALTSMKLRSSIKDVCRVMFPGGVPAEVEELTSRMLKPPQGVDDSKFVFGYVDDEEVKHEGSITYDAALMEFTQKYPGPWAVAQKCLGLTRQRTRHPCGFAIAGREIDDLVPLTVVGKEKSVTTSFPADGCEDAGIIKYDFLTVNSVRDIDQCLKLIRERTPGWESLPGLRGVRSVPWRGQLHDVWDLPNDQAVLRELAAGHTETVFQLCTPSAKKWLKAFNHNKPDGTPVLGSVEALAAFVALDRPGPLNAELMSPDGGTHNMMVEYCRRARGQQGSPDINDKFEKLFPETYGLCCLSEDSMVKTASGEKKIQDVQVGDLVETHTRQFKKVLANINNGIRSCVALRLSSGEELILTPDHKMLTARGWVAVEDLIVRSDIIQQNWVSDDEIEDGDERDWVVGLLLANGNLGESTPSVACMNREFAEKVKEIADRAWGVTSVVAKYGRTWYCRFTYNVGGGRTPNPVMTYLRQEKLYGLDSFTKRFPDRVSFSMAVGLFDGDGCGLNRRIRLKNKLLARKFFEILQARRVCSAFHEDEEGVWCVAVMGNLPLKIRKWKSPEIRDGYTVKPDLSFVCKKNHGRAYQHSRSERSYISRNCLRELSRELETEWVGSEDVWGLVLSVKPVGERQVYDLSVDEDHSFLVGGSVAHNCYQEQVERLTQEMAGITASEAVELRGLLAKKKRDEVEKWRPRFVEGATKVLGSEEEARKLWTLIFNFSQYSFNLSHSVCYAVIAYACGFLKHHFPLEWWTAVLKNASKDEVEETFWQHCGKLVDPPHVNLSGANYEIRDGRIRAPISLINGVGEKAQKQLEEGRPYTDIRDFVTKQRDWQRRNATKTNAVPSAAKKPSKSKKPNPEGLKLATSALHRGVVGKLISSGVMDTLFPPGMTLLDQLDSYEQILAEVTGCKREPVDPMYGKLTEIQRYQLRKSVLPAYSDCLTRMVHTPDLERSHLSISHTDRRSYLVDGEERLVIPTYDETQFMNFHEPLSTELAVGVVAYVTTARPFTWDGKVAVEYVLELDGGRFRAVWWPRKNRKPKDFGTGAVVAGRMSRSRSGSVFSIDYLVSVSPPL